jgi:hypothetical protein
MNHSEDEDDDYESQRGASIGFNITNNLDFMKPLSPTLKSSPRSIENIA